MKKSILALGLALATVFGASAQMQVIKDAEQTLKKADSYQALMNGINAIKPAFTNPETQNLAQTYFVPGKYAFKVYDYYFTAQQLGGEVNKKDAGNALMQGFALFAKALPLDSLPDAKGKVKPKYSKEIGNILGGHFNDFDRVAVDYYQAGDFQGAYDAWDALLFLAANPKLTPGVQVAFNDTVTANIRLNQSSAAIQAKNLEAALAALEKGIATGVGSEEMYNRAAIVAHDLKDMDKFIYFSRLGNEKYGKSNPVFLQYAVNGYIDQEKFDEAKQLLQDELTKDPNNGAVFASLGVLSERTGNLDDAIANYEKACQLTPVAKNYLHLGNAYAQKNNKVYDAYKGKEGAEYQQYFKTQQLPLLKNAANALEEAYRLDPENGYDALKVLSSLYYEMKDNTNYERIEQLRRQ